MDLIELDVNSLAYKNYLTVYNVKYKRSVQEIESTFNWGYKLMMEILENHAEEYLQDPELLADLVECININTKLSVISVNNPRSKFIDGFAVMVNLNRNITRLRMPFKIQVLDFQESDLCDCYFFRMVELDEN